jgi:hypothetical protein
VLAVAITAVKLHIKLVVDDGSETIVHSGNDLRFEVLA